MTADPPRILHLFANYKWTGPADPAIRTAAHLRRAGADVVFAQAAWLPPGGEHRMAMELARWRVPVIGGLELRKHFRLPSVIRDVRRLRRRLARGEFTILHTHLPGDHLIAALACRGVRPAPVLVRTLYDPGVPHGSVRSAWSLRRTHGVVVPTRRLAAGMQERGFSAARVLYQDPPVEPPGPRVGDLRERWGVAETEKVVGITARVQPHRRFELLWAAARAVVDRAPEARFVLLGRGNQRDLQELVRDPVQRLGLQRHVILPGYLHEPDYSRALDSLDLFLFLVPGSDGTCRAVREAMARGLPVVSTRRGILPELLMADSGNETARPAGICCAEDSEELAAALVSLVHDGALRERLGAAGRWRARRSMDPVAASARLLEFYGRLTEMER